MIHATVAFYFIFAILTQLGGVLGFVKAKSKVSLIAGLVSGALLDLAGALIIVFPARPVIGLATGGIVTFLLLGRFAPAYFNTKKLMPAGMMVFLGMVSLALTMAALAGF